MASCVAGRGAGGGGLVVPLGVLAYCVGDGEMMGMSLSRKDLLGAGLV